MARNEAFIAAAPKDVFAVLSDPARYGDWVPGTRAIRGADADWPAPGSDLHHTAGPPLIGVSDRTTVTHALPPLMLELRARGRPLPSARVSIQLQPEGNGTRVTLIEDPASRTLCLLIGPLGHGLIKLRNVEALRRLKEIVEGRR